MQYLLIWLVCIAMDSAVAKKADIDKPIPVTEVSVVDGNTARLACDLKSSRPEDSAYLVLWYIETQKQPIYSVDLRARPLEEAKHWADDRITNRAQFVTHGIASLMLANVSAADSAFYRCRVDFRHSPTRHFRYKLNVVSLPQVPLIYDHEGRRLGASAGPYNEGADLALTCEVEGGGPLVVVTWLQDGRSVDWRPALQRPTSGMGDRLTSQLQLRRLGRSDHGSVVSCRASVDVVPPVDAVSRNTRLNVRLRPLSAELMMPMAPLEAGKVQQIQCRTTGANPSAFITWWYGLRQITDADNQIVHDGNGTVSTLTMNFSMEDNGRNLMCRAETPELPGSAIDSDHIRMNVHYPPRASLELGRRFVADEIREGDDIYLECHVRANPPIHRLIWLHKKLPVIDDRKSGIIISNQTLVLRNVGRHTVGNYTCVATNRQGETPSRSLPVLVKYSPVCRRSRPVVVVLASDQTASLRCQVEADPAEGITFRWTLSTGRETSLVGGEAPVSAGLSSTLQYTPRRDADFGQLQCWAKNEIGQQVQPCVFNIVKEGLPLKPLQCELSSLVKGAWEVKCRQPRFLVPAQNATADDQLDADEGADGDAENDLVIGSSSLVYWLELFDAESGQLLHNVSSPTPRFSVRAIDPAARVAAVVSSVNRQGRSPPVRLEGAVERAVGSRAVNNDAESTSVTTVILLVAPGALLLAIVVLAVILAVYQRQRKRNPRLQQQPPPAASTGEYHRAVVRQPDLIKSQRSPAIDGADTAVIAPTDDYQLEATDASTSIGSARLFAADGYTTYHSATTSMESRQTQQRRKINDNEDEDNGAIVIDMFPKMKNQLGGVCPTQRASTEAEDPLHQVRSTNVYR